MPAADGSINLRVRSKRKAGARCTALKPTEQPTLNTNKASYHRQSEQRTSSPVQYKAVGSPRSRSEGFENQTTGSSEGVRPGPRPMKRAASMPSKVGEEIVQATVKQRKVMAARRSGPPPGAKADQLIREEPRQIEASSSVERAQERSKSRKRSASAGRQKQAVGDDEMKESDGKATMMPAQILGMGKGVTLHDLESAMTVIQRQLDVRVKARDQLLQQVNDLDIEIGDLESMLGAVHQRRDNRVQAAEASGARSVHSSRSRSADRSQSWSRSSTASRTDDNCNDSDNRGVICNVDGEARDQPGILSGAGGEAVLSLTATPATDYWDAAPKPYVSHKRTA